MHQSSATRGMLRDAIQKVVTEIAFHESEASKHLKQAADLRKDLRESFAFVQDRGDQTKANRTVAAGQPEKDAEPGTPPKGALIAADKPQRGATKKKSKAAGRDI